MIEFSRMIFDKAPFASCHASTVVEVEPGRLMSAWFAGKAEGAKDVKIWLSEGDGKSWSAPTIIAEEPNQPTWNPVLFLSRKGLLHLWYKAGPSPDTWSGFLRTSKDLGKTWSPATILPAGMVGPVRCKPIQLDSGIILCGSSVESYKTWCGWVESTSDEEKTWQRFGPLEVPGKPFGVIQPTLVEMGRGKVVAFLRTRGMGKIARCESADSGKTWSPAELLDLPNPNAGIDVVKITGERLVLIYNHTPLGRSPLNLAMSKDAGRTWQVVEKLETAIGEYSYPAMIVNRRGKLDITYTYNRVHIKFVRVDPTGW